MAEVEVKNKETNEGQFYEAAAKYWDNIPPTVNGMLGGFGFISHTDIKGSTHLLKYIFSIRNPPGRGYVLDCGAGIGRITKNLLVKHFKRVDLVEQCTKFLETAKNNMADVSPKIGEYYNTGLQNFTPELKKYDVIWCQWVLGHLEDDDFIQFFKRCSEGLKDNGVIVVKENVTSSNKLEFDRDDSSVTRPYEVIDNLFKKADLKCIKVMKQNNFPNGLFPVYMFALRPMQTNNQVLVENRQ